MRKWEYLLERMPGSVNFYKGPNDHRDPKELLDELGQDGWELAGIDYGCFILKRQISLDVAI